MKFCRRFKTSDNPKETVLNKFDPFNSRLARDIRNSLSVSFLDSLAEADSGLYRKKAEEYFKQNLEQPYLEYVGQRLKKYDLVFGLIKDKGIYDIMRQAEVLWAHKLYFELHELLEKLWIRAEGDRRGGLQGLIRAAGMKIQAECGNLKAAESMGQKALNDLELYGHTLTDFTGLEAVSAEVSRTLSTLPEV